MNNHIKFWITLGSLISLISVFVIIAFISFYDQQTITINKQYGIFIIPFLIYFIIQFVINYTKLTENEENRSH